MKTQSRITNKKAQAWPREKFARHRRTKGHNQRRARRLESPSPLLRACVLLSWAAVDYARLHFLHERENGQRPRQPLRASSRSSKNLLVAGATALFGHEVDGVSPVGISRIPAAWRRARKRAALHAVTAFESNATARPAGMLGDFPAPPIALIFSSLYGVSDEFHQILRPAEAATPWIGSSTPALQPSEPPSYGPF